MLLGHAACVINEFPISSCLLGLSTGSPISETHFKIWKGNKIRQECRLNCLLYVVIYPCQAIFDVVEMRILTLRETASSRGGLIVDESAVRWRSTAVGEETSQN